MSMILLVYIAILVYLTLSRYSNFLKVAAAGVFLFGLTTWILLHGLTVFSTMDLWHVFGKDLSRNIFVVLICTWYAVDGVCFFLILRNYRLYRSVNG